MYILTDKEFRHGKEVKAVFDGDLPFHVIQMGLQSQGVTHFVEKTVTSVELEPITAIVLYSPTNEWQPLTLSPNEALLYRAALNVSDLEQQRLLLKKIARVYAR